MDMPSKALTRLTHIGNIDYFYLSNQSIYYVTSSLTVDPKVYRMSLDGKKATRVSPIVLEAQDKSYQYFFGWDKESGDFVLKRKPLPSTGEMYTNTEENSYENTEADEAEKLSTYQVYFSDYIGDAESDTFVYAEHDEKTQTSYLHLFNKGKDTVRKLREWEAEPVDIVHGWVYFTAYSIHDSVTGGLFAVRPDGTGLRQVGNGDLNGDRYVGSIKSYLVFRKLNKEGIPDGGFTFIKE
ncbi:hypothetical protein [Paenibacillus durus]|uniref:Uncharacterized protein n=1 Tax=Paenibacillus durus ATCC 35681 TaxID=1333534 RepID=A0A0F7CIR4_PAEDU|nr:hypothetical protein [Paenibacillus durus]AKG34825.1 hypothetical protein VK70_09790 [Paenibacillus durus ATCC 35681]